MLHSRAHTRTPSADEGRHRQQLPIIIPPSPTLSNPDMILPFDQTERESQTPSPPFNLPSLSHLQAFYENRAAPIDYGADAGSAASAAAGPYTVTRAQTKGFPRHTWVHEGHDPTNRRLSAIGEEDSSSPTRVGGFGGNVQGGSQGRWLAVSPLSRPGAEESENKDAGSWSSSSSSTVSAASETSSHEGSRSRQNGQAAPQENRSLEHRQIHEAVRAIKEGAKGGGVSDPKAVSTTQEGGGADELSSVILSSEAERILENAKKRLTLMEGNLTRARTSVRVSPSPSPSPSGSGPSMGLGQPVGGLYRSISRTDRRSSTMRPRATYSSSQDQPSNRHSRVYSETYVPSAAHPSISTAEPDPSRSMSAMGSSRSSDYNHDDRSFHYAPTRSYLTHRASVSSIRPPIISRSSDEHSSTGTGQDLGVDQDGQQISSLEDFNSIYPSQDPPSRSQSQLQVRDLQDQMKGLHIKISSLKVKAQGDNLRRRSLQLLRTPSPLTAANHANQWQSNDVEYKSGSGEAQPDAEYMHMAAGVSGDRSSDELDVAARKHETDSRRKTKEPSPPRAATHPEPPAYEPADNDDAQSVIESLYEDAEDYNSDGLSDTEIDRDELNEILNEPLDDDLADPLEAFPAVPQHPDFLSHEDREDAFDYEHFILHSALGNYTQARRRQQSNASYSSVETTRPLQGRRSMGHSRANSATSLSTVATFATATEGADADFEGVLYWDRRFNDEMRNHDRFSDSDPEDPNLDDQGTPRAVRKRPSHPSSKSSSTKLDDKIPEEPPQRSDSATTGSATPTSLVSSLVSTVRAASSQHPNSPTAGITNDDERLLEQLFQSLGDVCMELQALTGAGAEQSDPRHVRQLRQRLKNARRVLDGELDT
ncbi:hypothetical protein P168DRAFT_316067 [Aspergillus campestris IBT 28561]|uniref:Uncharacterized protein n=1 Tax=Aspergillus campestris (strain IBT 28561) TaxID=1392248 RepID=A0A2I1DCJ0_ASPC2|nr:uncharacterized protein P168DRAFT_316067 [Aspergillus campestris IBT 28561]PKY07575.1 hypothetical protein P168DRAFT_316067 [Aspergillus campestris IBT 28561]